MKHGAGEAPAEQLFQREVAERLAFEIQKRVRALGRLGHDALGAGAVLLRRFLLHLYGLRRRFVGERPDLEFQVRIADAQHRTGSEFLLRRDPHAVDERAGLSFEMGHEHAIAVDVNQAMNFRNVEVVQADVGVAGLAECNGALVGQLEGAALVATIYHFETARNDGWGVGLLASFGFGIRQR